LERVIFEQIVDPKILSGVKDFEEKIQDFQTTIEAWKGKHLSGEFFTNGTKRPGTSQDIEWYIQVAGPAKDTLDAITGSTITSTLEYLITKYINYLEENQTFGVKRNNELFHDKNFVVKTISFYQLKTISNFYTRDEGKVGVDINGIFDVITAIERDFVQQRNKLESDIEAKMNEIVKKTDIGIGFEPTVRNIVGVLLANAETYIRLMKDVHLKAFDQAKKRKEILKNVSTDSIGDSIYPWPEIKAQTAGGLALVYPGGRELGDKLQAGDTTLWPEVDFVENFYEVATKKADNLTDKEGSPENINYIFATDLNLSKKDIGVLTNVSGYIPYGDKAISSILYEIYERSKYVTSLNPFSNDVTIELANVEYDNLKVQIAEDIDIIDILKAYITNYESLLYYMGAFSEFERYTYYQDQLPTVPYIKDVLNQDFSIKKYQKNVESRAMHEDLYTKLSKFLLDYQPEEYRTIIYPFNSSTYKSYRSFELKNLSLNGLLKVNAPEDFISSGSLPLNPYMWVKDGYGLNLFNNVIKIGDQYKHILNTPYFHKQLYDDFTKLQPQEKYVGSAYLFLNSLPFKDLDDTISFGYAGPVQTDTLVSTLFREIGASHYVPYHLMLKWGSIYHRYKKYINDSIDIISNVTIPISGDIYFDNSFTGRTYTGYTNPVKIIDRSATSDVGFHPFYDTVFHQIVNGYGFFDQIAGPVDYSASIDNGVIKTFYREAPGGTAWSTVIDESKFDSVDQRFTLIPSNGYKDIDASDFDSAEQENFRILWNIGTDYSLNYVNYSGYTFPSPDEYFKLTGSTDTYSLSTNYRKVIDLIATFKFDILDIFEQAFLNFASESLNEEIPYVLYDVKYPKFQDLLKEIVSVSKTSNDPIVLLTGVTFTNNDSLFTIVRERQTSKLLEITSNILSTDNLIRISLANPREIDNYVLGGFTNTGVERFSVNEFDPFQLTDPDNINNMKLYLGEDLDGYYADFFSVNNIEINEDNIKQFRSLIYIYAGMRADGETPTKDTFITYLKEKIVTPTKNNITGVSGPNDRLKIFLDQIGYKIQNDLKRQETQGVKKKRGYSDDIIKLELYNLFKSFNDKWTSGNSIGQRTLMEEFLFLDKANRDIGSSVYIDMEKLMRLTAEGNEKINLFSAISLLVQDTGFDIRALPAYVNFYGTNFSDTKKIIPSKNVAQNLFGSFLDIDTMDSSPKIILQYIGPTSKHLELYDIDSKYKYKNDGFNIGDVNNNPVIVAPDVFTKSDLSKSNKVVAFEVSFGDQNQSIFKSVELDQSSIKNTSETFPVLERLGRSETGSSTAQIDIGLFDIYRQSSYQCQVTCMGDVMIQPTMYFYLKNIPMFRGSYWITEVTHNIRTTGIETTFKGSRMPLQSLPNPIDSFLASYRSFFDKLVKRADVKIKEEQMQLSGKTATENTMITDSGSYSYDMGAKDIAPKGEKLVNQAGVTEYGIPYNGFDGEKYIQLISYQNENNKWLRTVAVLMDGTKYPIESGITMTIISNLKTGSIDTPRQVIWNELRNLSKNQDFYVTRFNRERVSPDSLVTHFPRTIFLNPNTQIPRSEIVITKMSNSNHIYAGPVSVGPSTSVGAGIGLSKSLMTKLGLTDGQIVYFKLSE